MNPNAPTHPSATETLVRSVIDVGEAWAGHGLKVARLALLTSARTLESTARALDALQHAVDAKSAGPTDAAAAPTPGD